MAATAQEVVAGIQAFLRRERPFNDDEVIRMAGEFALVVTDVDRRLERCLQLANQGLRDEAAGIADAPPPLLELAAAIEFPEHQIWRTYCIENHLPVGPVIAAAKIQALDEVYSKLRGLEPLINEYRRMCIRGKPARERIVMLRRLRKADPTNASWVEDQRGLEVVRFKEIAVSLSQDRGSFTEAQAGALVLELKSPELATEAPAELVAAADRLYQELRQKRLTRDAESHAAKLNDAYAAMDVAQASAASDAISNLCTIERFTLPESVASRITDANNWVAQQRVAAVKQEEFDRLSSQLAAMLEKPKDHASLAAMLRKLESYGLDLDQNLAFRSRTALRVLQAGEQRRRRTKTIAIIAACVLLVVGSAAGGWWYLESQAIGKLEGDIRGLTDKRQFEGARKLIATTKDDHPKRLKSPQVVSAIEDLELAVQKEHDREVALADVVEQLSKCSHTDAVFIDLESRGRGLAVTDAEKHRVASAVAAVRARELRATRDTDEVVLEKLKTIAQRLRQLRETEDVARIQSETAELEQILNEVRSVSGISEEIRSTIAEHRTQINAERARASELQRIRNVQTNERTIIENKLTQAMVVLPSVKTYADAYERLRKDHPGVPQVRDIDHWLPLAKAYDSVLAVSDEMRGCRNASGAPFVPGRHIAAVESALKRLNLGDQTPFDSMIAATHARWAYLEKYDEHSSAIRKLVAHPLMTRVGLWQGQYIALSDERIKDSMLVYFDAEHHAVAVYRNYFDPKKVPEAPHVKLVANIAKLVRDEQTKTDWQSLLPSAFVAVFEDKDANPRARALLLRDLLPVNVASGNVLQFTPGQVQVIEEIAKKQANFLAPTSDKDVREKLEGIEKDLADLWKTLLPVLKGDVPKAAARIDAELSALLRPLVISAIVELGPDGKAGVRELGKKRHKEYWIVEKQDGRTVFRIVAIAKEGKPEWYDNWTPRIGMPLLSPADESSTLQAAEKLDLSESKAWPVNAVQPGKTR